MIAVEVSPVVRGTFLLLQKGAPTMICAVIGQFVLHVQPPIL